MKKNFLKMFSKLLGVFSLVACFGFALFSLLDHKQNKKQEVCADYYIDSLSLNGNTTYQNQASSNTALNYSYTSEVSFGFIDGLGQRYIYSFDLVFKNGSANNFSYNIYDESINENYFHNTFSFNTSTGYIPDKLYYRFDSISTGSSSLIGGGVYGGYYSVSYNYQVFSGTSPLTGGSGTFTTSYRLLNSNNLLLSSDEVFSIQLDLVNADTSSSQAYIEAYNNGFNQGYDSGQITGYSNGYSVGYDDGVASQEQVITDSYNNGYSEGYNEGFSTNSTATTIFSGILQIAMVPVNFFLGIFNFEILGINVASFVSALLTVAITIIIIRIVTGKKND